MEMAYISKGHTLGLSNLKPGKGQKKMNPAASVNSEIETMSGTFPAGCFVDWPEKPFAVALFD